MDTPFMKKVSQQQKQEFRKRSWESVNSPREFLGSTPWEFPGTALSPLASLETVTGVADAGPVLMSASKSRPGQDKGGTGRRGKEQTSQEMACFRDREWTQIGGHVSFVVRLFGGRVES